MQNQETFLALVRAGLFPMGGSQCKVHESVDWGEVYRLAEG